MPVKQWDNMNGEPFFLKGGQLICFVILEQLSRRFVSPASINLEVF